MNRTLSPRDSLDVAELFALLKLKWYWVVSGLVVGALSAWGLITLAPPTYEATASLVVRDRKETASGSLRGQGSSVPGLADLLGGQSWATASVETQLELLQSRALLGQVVDSLRLQIRVLTPRRWPADSIFLAAELPPAFPRTRISFQRKADGYEVHARGGFESFVQPGQVVSVGDTRLTLRPGTLVERIVVELRDRQELVEEILRRKQYRVSLAGGDVAEIKFRGPDPITAAKVVNLAARLYLEERRKREKSLADQQLMALVALADSLEASLGQATQELAFYQTEIKGFEPDRLGDLERAARLRARADELRVEIRAVDRILAGAERDSLSVSEFAAFPSLLESEAIKGVLERILNVETQRIELLKRRTEQDPDVLLAGRTLHFLKEELVSLARSYRDGLRRQEEELRQTLETYRAALAARPFQERRLFELQSEIQRLTAAYQGVAALVVAYRAEEAGRGLDLRIVDPALPPKKAQFPIPWLTWVMGLALGLGLGSVLAIVQGFRDPFLRRPDDLQRMTGLPLLPVGTGLGWLSAMEGRHVLLALEGGKRMSAFASEAERMNWEVYTRPEEGRFAGSKEESVVAILVEMGATRKESLTTVLAACEAAGLVVCGILYC